MSITAADIAREKLRRAKSPWKNYAPLPHQLDAHLCDAKEKIVLGGNRAGKSTWGAKEFAARVLRRPIVADGVEYELPDVPKIAGTYWVVGRNMSHIGQTLYRLLFEPGLIKIANDGQGGFRPWDPNVDDMADAIACDPLIGPDQIEEWVWESEKERLFRECRLKNGNVIRAYGSGSDVKKGDPVQLIWFDEDIKDGDWLAESLGRLLDTNGRFIWTATPDSKNFALLEMVDKARDQEEDAVPDTVCFKFSSMQNRFLPKESVERAIRTFSRTGDAANRIEGEMGLESVSVYPMLSRSSHVTGRGPQDTPLERWLGENNGNVPFDAANYLYIDPGHAVQAAIMIAVPPPSVGPYWLVHGEVNLRQAPRSDFAKLIADRVKGRFLVGAYIDRTGGRVTHYGETEAVVDKYYRALKEVGIGWVGEAVTQSLRFTDNRVLEGLDAVRNAFSDRPHFGPKLMFHGPSTSLTVMQMERYRKHVIGDVVTDKPHPRQRCDLCDVVRYGVMNRPLWVDVHQTEVKPNPVYLAWQKRQSEMKKRNRAAGLIGAGSRLN